MTSVSARLRELLPNSHSPYSGVRVAAAVEGPDGGLHLGVNVENAAYPQGICAEASAISAAVSSGETRIARVYLASSLPGRIWPCGGCRQKIFEFAEPDCEVVSFAPDGSVERYAIAALLPLGFRLSPRG